MDPVRSGVTIPSGSGSGYSSSCRRCRSSCRSGRDAASAAKPLSARSRPPRRRRSPRQHGRGGKHDRQGREPSLARASRSPAGPHRTRHRAGDAGTVGEESRSEVHVHAGRSRTCPARSRRADAEPRRSWGDRRACAKLRIPDRERREPALPATCAGRRQPRTAARTMSSRAQRCRSRWAELREGSWLNSERTRSARSAALLGRRRHPACQRCRATAL